MADDGTWGKLKVDLIATLEAQAQPTTKFVSTPVTSTGFLQTGTHPNLMSKTTSSPGPCVVHESGSMKTPLLSPSMPTDFHQVIAGLLESSNELLNSYTNAEELLSDTIQELREAGELDQAKNLRYAVRALRNALEDIKDASELIGFLDK